MQIEIERVNIGDSRRGVDKATVEKLAESMTQVGLLNPITIDHGYNLIAGAHRVEAAKKLGWKLIDCTMIDIEDLQAKLAELDENLVRNQGTVIEQGEWLAEKKKIYEQLHPETKKGISQAAGMNKAIGNVSDNLSPTLNVSEINSLTTDKSFVTDTAEKTGLSKRTIEQSIQIAENLAPEVKAFAKEIGITKTNALDLARKPQEDQKRIVDPIRSFVATVAPEERKETAQRLLGKELRPNKRTEDYAAPAIKTEEVESIRNKYTSAIKQPAHLEMKQENIECFVEQSMRYGILDTLTTMIDRAIENLKTVRGFMLNPKSTGGYLS